MPLKWRLFQIACILQVALTGLYALYHLFYMLSIGGLVRALCFGAMSLFAAMGSGIINNNYPDVLIEGALKKRFNILYLINFLLVAYLVGMIVADFRITLPFIYFGLSFTGSLLLYGGLITKAVIFVLQIVLLVGLFRLRRLIFQNYYRTLEEFTGGPGTR